MQGGSLRTSYVEQLRPSEGSGTPSMESGTENDMGPESLWEACSCRGRGAEMRTFSWRSWPFHRGWIPASPLPPSNPVRIQGQPQDPNNASFGKSGHLVPHSVLSPEAPKGGQHPFPVHRTQPAKTQEGFLLGCEMVKGTPKSL